LTALTPPAPPSLTGAAAVLAPGMTALLDALPAQAALLDGQGLILAVNAAWRHFAAANRLTQAQAGVGLNYLAVCDAARDRWADEAPSVAEGIRRVLAGELPMFTLDYPCHGAGRQRWFRVSVTPCPAVQPHPRLALVMHSPITEHVQQRNAAREGEARYRAVFEHNPLPMWVYELDSLRFLAVNAAAVAHYGYSVEEFLGMTLADIRPTEDLPALWADVAGIDRGSQVRQLWRHRLKDGTLIQVEVHARSIPWEGGTARLVTAQDVTAREQAAAALRESERRFRQITDAISEVFWLSEGGRLLYVSPGYEVIWGRSPVSLMQQSVRWFETIHPDDRERVARALPLQAQGDYDIEYRILRPDGSIRWIADRAFVVGTTSPAGDERLAGVARDITAERESQARLRLLETAVARLNDIVLITEAEPLGNPGPRIVFVNDAFERRTGYTRDEVIGRTPRLLQGPATQRSELDRIGAALRRWEPVRAELINYTKAGEPFWLELDIVPLANDAGWYTHWVAIERDITERKQVEAQLRQSQRLESLGQLTGGVAHDFNNLLTVMLGNAELLAEQLPAEGLHQRLATMIAGAAQRGADLTQRLLAFARRQALEPRAVQIDRLVADMDGLIRRTLGEHIEVLHVPTPGLWSAMVDPTQLENVLLNLAINARDAMPGGGHLGFATANVRLDAAAAAEQADLAAGDYVVLQVSDTGCGIAPELLPRVCEPFFTTKEKGKGTGLGLAMAYGFAKQSRGHLGIESQPGQGTTVRVYLPAHEEPHAAEAARLADGAAPAGVGTGTGQCVLLVEDDAAVRDFARDQLERLGYRVVEAADGPSALALLQACPDIELLFTDVIMPGGLSGRELADAARRLRPGLPVLYTSGYTANALTNDGRLAPGVLLLSKPYRRADLALKLQEALHSAPPAPGAAR